MIVSPRPFGGRAAVLRTESRGFRSRVIIASAVAALLSPTIVSASNYVWDPSGTGTSDGSGNWDLSTSNWYSGSLPDVVWPNGSGSSSIAVFGNGSSTPATVTLNTTGITTNGLTFNAGSAYTIAGTAANALTLAGTTPTITANANANISAVLTGTAGLTTAGTGTLVLSGSNTYTGGTIVTAGTLQVNTGGSLGGGAVTLGNSAASSTVSSNLAINTNTTITNFTDNTQTATDTLVIAPGAVLTTGVFAVQLGGNAANNSSMVLNTYTGTNTPGSGGELDVNNSMTVGYSLNAGSNLNTVSVDLSGLSTFRLTAPGGALNIAASTEVAGFLTLANSTNVINVASAYVGVSDAPGSGGNFNALHGTTLTLGPGTNVIEANTFVIGGGKGNAIVQFNSASGSISISGTSGTGTSNITVSNGNVGSSSTAGTIAAPAVSLLALAGHNATVQAGTVIDAIFNNAAKNISQGTITFDTGTFNASSMQIATVTGTAALTAAAGATGTFTLGTNSSSTGVLNVTGSFVLASNTETSTAQTCTATGTFNINGGTANILSNITVTSTKGTTNATINLSGGTLNMGGFAIGGTGAVNSGTGPITNFNMPGPGNTATLENLGGTGIYAGAGTGASTGGVVHAGGGTLILAGTNTYSGPTTVTSGTLQIGSGTLGGSIPAASIVTNNSILAFGGSQPINISNAITGSGVVNQIGTGTTTLSGTSTYSGISTISSGTLAITGAISGDVALTGGVLAGTGSVGNVNNSGGAIHPGATGADLSVGSLSMLSLNDSSGDLRFDIGGSGAAGTADSISDSGAATFGAGSTVSLALDSAPTTTSFTLLTAAGGITGMPTLSTTVIGRTDFALVKVGNSLVVNVTGTPASLIWGKIGGSGDGTTWDNLQDNQNWNRSGTADTFYNADNVTFNDNNQGFNLVNVTTQVTPGSVTFANNSVAYTFNGSGGITGASNVAFNGSGSVTFNTVNTYTGITTVNAGSLILGSGGSISSPNFNVAGGAVTINSGGGLASPAVNITSGSVTVASGGSLTATTPLVTVGSGAFFNIASGAVIPATTAIVDNGTVNDSNSTVTLTSLTGTGKFPISGVTTLIVGGSVSPSLTDGATQGSLNVANTLTLTGSNTYTGATTIASTGNLQIGDGTTNGSLSATTAISNAGTLTYNLIGTPTVNNTIANSGTVVFNGTGSPTFAGTITGAGAIQQSGTGTTSLTGNLTGWTGSFVLGGGTLNFNYPSPTTFSNPIGIIAGALTTIDNTGKLTLSGTESVGTTANTITYNVTPVAGLMPDGVNADVELTGSISRSGNSDGVGVVKTGLGTLALSGSTDNGSLGVIVNAGTLLLNKASSSTAHAVGGGGLTVNSGGTARITGTGGDQIYDAAGTVAITDGGTFDMNGQSETVFNLTLGDTAALGTGVIGNFAPGTSSVLIVGSTVGTTSTGTFTEAGPANIYAAANSTFELQVNGKAPAGAAAQTLTANGPGTVLLTGTTDNTNVTVAVSGGGTLVLDKTSATAHAASSVASVAAGSTLQLGNSGLFVPDQIYNGYSVANGAGVYANYGVFNMNGTFDMNGQNEDFDKLTGSGTVINSQSGSTSTLTLGTNNGLGTIVSDFTGTITGNIALVKENIPGGFPPAVQVPVILSGSNTYSGGTTISSGILQIGDGGSGGTLGTGPVSDNDTLNFNRSDNGATSLVVSNQISGSGQLNQNGTGTVTLAASNSYSGPTTVNAGTLKLAVAGALPAGANLTVAANASVVALHLAVPTALQLSALSNSGLIDLNNNGLDVAGSSSFSAIYSQVQAGYNGGAWNATTGIISTDAATNSKHLTALGVIINDNGSGSPLYGNGGSLASTFNGVTPNDGDVLVKYTYYGDANLDGAVDGSDYSLIDAGFGSHGTLTGWYNGDFNYDGKIDGSDYTLIDNAFNTQGASLGTNPASQIAATAAQFGSSSSSAVPEPATLGLLGVGAVGLLGRRRRR